MNLAFLTRRYGQFGGTERDLHELTRRLVDRGHEIHVYCCEQRMTPPPGVTVHKIRVVGFGRLARFFSVAFLGPRQAKKNGHDLLISYERAVHQDVARCGGGTHRRFLQRMVESSSTWKRFARSLDPYHRLVLLTEKRQFSRGHYRRVHAVSELVKQELMAVYGVPASDIDVIYCGVDTDRFTPDNRATDGTEVRQELGIPADARVALFLGNGFKRKGLDTFLAAVAKTDAVHGLVVGTDSQMPSYVELTRQLGAADRIHFAGQQADTWRYYAAADAFALPSVQEAFGVVVLEALATGLPCIVSSRAGAAEVLPEAAHDYLLQDPLDADELARKIEEVLEPALREQLSTASRNTALRYSLDEHTQVSEAHYEQLCS